MKTKKHSPVFFVFVSLSAIILYLLDSTGIMTLKIGTAHPILLIPLLVAVSMTAREWIGLVFGAFFGILLDVSAADGFCFNLMIMLCIGTACGLLCSYVMNEHIYSAVVLSVCSALFYFLAKWLRFYVIGSKGDTLNYLITYSLPSAAYTALFILPFYYFVKSVSKRTHYII